MNNLIRISVRIQVRVRSAIRVRFQVRVRIKVRVKFGFRVSQSGPLLGSWSVSPLGITI